MRETSAFFPQSLRAANRWSLFSLLLFFKLSLKNELEFERSILSSEHFLVSFDVPRNSVPRGCVTRVGNAVTHLAEAPVIQNTGCAIAPRPSGLPAI